MSGKMSPAACHIASSSRSAYMWQVAAISLLEIAFFSVMTFSIQPRALSLGLTTKFFLTHVPLNDLVNHRAAPSPTAVSMLVRTQPKVPATAEPYRQVEANYSH